MKTQCWKGFFKIIPIPHRDYFSFDPYFSSLGFVQKFENVGFLRVFIAIINDRGAGHIGKNNDVGTCGDLMQKLPKSLSTAPVRVMSVELVLLMVVESR
ncbi:MAG: hypothetical protein H6577_04320 [Lewinellaceae bacterium]|nr:hypothetical protein [Lewinellaceae bacterium]